jgi:hypothetical protein
VIVELHEFLILLSFFIHSSLVPASQHPSESQGVVEVFTVQNSELRNLTEHNQGIVGKLTLTLAKEKDLVCSFDEFFLFRPKLRDCLDLLENSFVLESQDYNLMLENCVLENSIYPGT